jgi:diacylglycerol kinase family enzyme
LRLLLVVNSFASSVTPRNTVAVHERLARHHDVQVVETNRRGHATRFAEDAARRGIDVVVSFGGDGTLNEVATGIATSDTALAVLPGGSTNVFARTIGIPNDAEAAADLLVAALDRRDIAPAGLGRANGRFFTFHAGLGFDAAVVRRVEERAALKRYAGHPLFVLATIRTALFDYDRKRPHFDLRFGGDSSDGSSEGVLEGSYFTIVMNTNPYTFLGNRPFDLVPGSGLENALSVVSFTDLSVPHVVRTLLTALRGGGVSPGPWLDVRTGVTSVVVAAERAFPHQLDGDYLGETREVSFDWVPEAVRLVRSGV